MLLLAGSKQSTMFIVAVTQLLASLPLCRTFTPNARVAAPNTVAHYRTALNSFDTFQYVDDIDDLRDLYGDGPIDEGSHQVHKLSSPNSNYSFDDSEDDDDDDDDEEEELLGELIADGEAVVCIPNIASSEECASLFASALRACENQGLQPGTSGRSRFSVSDPNAFPSPVTVACESIVLRVLDYLDENVPSIYTTLFKPSVYWAEWQPLDANLEERTIPPDEYLADTCPTLRDLYVSGELEWSEGEPAINVYQGNGYFGAHKDHLALTMLMPLTSAETDFEGGGTGYWSGNRDTDENPQTSPDLILKPQPGSALIFGGDVTHAGLPIESGYRSVFVCSFSTKTSASPLDRLHGMQAPPEVSPNFKGTA